MRHDDIDRVFGRGRLQMVTGDHVEVFREEALPGERRRYTKRFLRTSEGDFRHWTEREWRILARLVGHGIKAVPEVVQFDRGALGRPALVQTYDAGVTVDHWATLLPVERDGRVLHHVFEDCAHWWALARHCLIALDTIHDLHLVHLDLKADNVCIPIAPGDFAPDVPGQALQPQFDQLALIDFAFSLVSGDHLGTAFPIGRQLDYDYQSPRLLHALEAGRHGDLAPTRELDWRCDLFSLAAMLERYLPRGDSGSAPGWKEGRHAQAQALLRRLTEAHDNESTASRPHHELIAMTTLALGDAELAASLARGWQLAPDNAADHGVTPTPVTRIALPVAEASEPAPPPLLLKTPMSALDRGVPAPARRPTPRPLVWGLAVIALAALSVPLLGEAWKVAQEDEPEAVAAAPSVEVARTPVVEPVKTSEVAASAVEIVEAAAPAAVAVDAPASAPVAVAVDAPASAPEPVPAPASAPAPAVQAAPAPKPAREAAPAPAPVLARAPATSSQSARSPKPVAIAKAAPPSSRSWARNPTIARAALAPKPAAKVQAPPRVAQTSPDAARAYVMAALARAPAPVVAPATAPVVVVPAPAPAPAAVAAAPVAAPPATAVATVTVTPPPAAAPPPAPYREPVRVIPPPPRTALIAPLPEDFVARAGVLLSDHLPRIAQRAERMVARVLHVASRSDASSQDDEVLVAARSTRLASDPAFAGIHVAPEDARLLNDAARVAYGRGRNLRQALTLQVRAFGADPQDAEVAGNLAFLHLLHNAARPETARQLALHALTTPDPRRPDGRIDDWTTFAVASALTGRERDARNAFFVSIALTQDLTRPCRAAVEAYAAHGERLRAPVEAMMERIRSWGRSHESPYCRAPSNAPIGVRWR